MFLQNQKCSSKDKGRTRFKENRQIMKLGTSFSLSTKFELHVRRDLSCTTPTVSWVLINPVKVRTAPCCKVYNLLLVHIKLNVT